MLMRIKTLFKGSSLYISIAITIAIGVLSLVKTTPKPIVPLSNLDKLQHSLAYFVLCYSWLISRDVKFRSVSYVFVLIGCLAFGIIIEVLQGYLTTYRTASLLDILSNSLGIGLGFIVFTFFKRKKADN